MYRELIVDGAPRRATGARETLRIRPLEGRLGEQVREEAWSSADPNEAEYVNEVAGTKDRVLLREMTTRFDETHIDRCRLEPAPVILKLPLRVGSSWSGEATCAELSLGFEGKVTGKETLDVGGKPVEVFVVESVVHIDDGEGTAMDAKRTEWILPSLRIPVRVVESDSSDPLVRRTKELVSIRER